MTSGVMEDTAAEACADGEGATAEAAVVLDTKEAIDVEDRGVTDEVLLSPPLLLGAVSLKGADRAAKGRSTSA